MTHTLHLGDCRTVLATLDDASIDAIVCDPPYELGFMGKAWDNSGIAYDVTVWQQCLRVLKPGGHLVAFGGSRTYHRLAVAIEDAGFEIRDQIQWIYGSGFPKSHNLKDDWQGWGTALKPAHEPAVLARKPLCGTVADNVTA
jgi:site-specific DNA-methyltransferase (adenine-specific)